MGKSNRTHQAPPIIEDLGEGSFYYNFNVVESLMDDEETMQYDYEQVRCDYPVDKAVIQACVDMEGYTHEVDLSGYE